MKRHCTGVLRLQMRRAVESKTLPYAFLSLMALITVCFVQSCLMFWGHDVGALPSAATIWVGNGWRSNAGLMTFVTSYLLFPLSAALFADCLYEDRSRGAAYLIASRTSLWGYLLSGALCSLVIAFVMTLLALLLSQAVALMAFPATASPDAYYVMYDLAATSDLGFSLLEGQPFSGLLFSNRYLYNLLYCVYDAAFAGAMALASYALSLFVRRNRLVVLGLPTMLLLMLSAVVPPACSVAGFLLPQYGSAGTPEWLVLATPALIAAVSLLVVCVSSKARGDVLR